VKLAALVLAALALPRAAAAAEGESALSVSAGAGTFVMPGEEEDETIAPTAGGVLGVAYERGFAEAWSWRLELSGALYGGGGLSYSANVAGGIVYRFDVLKYVPYGLLELGGVIVGGGPVPEDDSPVLAPVLQVGGGLDILKSRDRSWGIEARVATFLDDVTTVAISGRYTWRWGWF
jgi:hypothetical protein